MTHLKKQDSPVELCKRIITLGNTISIRMLEYMSATKHPVHGFQTLAGDFMDLSTLVWTIDAGLKDASQKHNAIPTEVTVELGIRLHQVHDEFIVVNTMITKLVENENKKGVFGKAFRAMFSGNDIDKVRHTLEKSRDNLRMGSAMFRWSVGDIQADSLMGIGYTGLAAALQRPSEARTAIQQETPISTMAEKGLPHAPRVQPLPSHLERTQRNGAHVDRSEVERPHPVANQPMRSPSTRVRSNKPPQPEDHPVFSDASQFSGEWQAPGDWRLANTRTERADSKHQVRRVISNDRVHNDVHTESRFTDNSSENSIMSRTYADSQDTHVKPHQHRYSQIDIPTEQRPTHVSSKHPSGATTIRSQAALAEAVQYQRHQALEQLLRGGTTAEPKMEASLFRTAIQNHDMESIELLLSSGANVNGEDKDGFTPLYVATEDGNYEAAMLLCELNADPNLSAGPLKQSPLCLAACEGRPDFVELFLTRGGDVNYTMENGNTALIYAVEHKTTVDALKALVRGADVNFKNNEGATALFQAILSDRVDLLEVLLDNGANPNLPAPKHPLWPSTYKPKVLQLMLARGADVKKTPGIMELASSLKKLESIKILMNAGVNPNVRKDGVYTPLCSAIRDNSREIVTYLLQNGADPNVNAAEYPAFKSITHNRPHFLPELVAAGVDLRTPKGIIECAVAHNNREALLYLFDQHVPINDKSPEGNTALTTAIREDRMDLVDLLLAHGADPAVRGADWPICMAIKRPEMLKKLLDKTHNLRTFRGVVEMAVVANQLESIKLLLAAGVSVEDKNCGVFSPLTTAIRERNKGIVHYLLDEAKADPNAPGEHLPLVKALRRLLPGDTEILELLLARGGDINKMHRGWNAVLQAIENGDADILRLLIEHGGPADLTLTDEVGKTVLETLQERGWEDGFAILCPETHSQE